jgi:hypothetical protein
MLIDSGEATSPLEKGQNINQGGMKNGNSVHKKIIHFGSLPEGV